MTTYKVGIFLFLMLSPFLVSADFIDVLKADDCESIIELYVDKQGVTARFEIGEEDFSIFSDIIPEKYFEGGYSINDQKARMSKFSQTVFVLKGDQQVLLGNTVLTDLRTRDQHDGERKIKLDSIEVDDQIVYVEIRYESRNNIKSLSIIPTELYNRAPTDAKIGFIAFHNSVPVNDLQLLLDEQKLNLDWSDPWYSDFDDKTLGRHHKSSFMSFLYIEPYEVRHEILGRIKDMEGWLDLQYEVDEEIPVSELDSLKEIVAEFLVNRNTVIIDGVKVKPIVDVLNFVQVSLDGVTVIENPTSIPYASAIIGVIFAYPHKSLPKKITMDWDLFNDDIKQVPCVTIDPAGPWPYDLSPSESRLEWTNFLKHYKLPMITEQKVEAATIDVPIFTVVFFLMILFVLFRNEWTLRGLSRWRKFFFVLYILLGILSFPISQAVMIPFAEKTSYTAPEAMQLMNHLLKNTYRAFDFRDEGDIYDKLALSTTNELLQDIYLQTRKSLEVEEQGNMEAKVNEVLVTNVVEVASEEGIAFRCNWIVKGAVGHWGHKHQRINRYDAIIRVVAIDGTWKMNELEVIDEMRL